TARQMGKSSLMIQTAGRLAQEDTQSVIIDLTSIGTQVTVEAWYLGLLTIIDDQLELDTDIVQWWNAHSHLGVTQRLTMFFKEVLLAEVASPIVVFVDEIDTTLSLDFTDDFFAAIRYLYTDRAREPELHRLSFVLIGVATPSDLIRDPRRTPFNIGEQIDLTDFTVQEALPLAEGLGLPPEQTSQILHWILKWTSGHPYLTQRLCQVLVDLRHDSWVESNVDHIVRDVFFGANSKKDNNLQFVRDMLTKRAPDVVGVLNSYRKIRRAKPPVNDEEQSLIKSHLKLSGIVCRAGHRLRVRNLIYRTVFDDKWVKDNFPDFRPTLRATVAVSILTAIVVVVARSLGLLQPLELRAFDIFLRSRPSEPTDERILIIGIDDEDIEKIETYPIPDKEIANLLSKVQSYQPAAIGLDLVRDAPVEPGHEELISMFRSSNNLIGVENHGNNIQAPPGLPSTQVGFADIVIDSDNYIRRVLFSVSPSREGFSSYSPYSLAFLLAYHYLSREGLTVETYNKTWLWGSTELLRLSPNFGGYVGLDSDGYQIMFNHRSGQNPFKIVSMRDVLTGNIADEDIRDRVILIGYTAVSIDRFYFSTNRELNNGVEFHAHAVSQILSAVLDERPLIWALPLWGDSLWIFGWSLIGGIVAWRLQTPWRFVLAGGLLFLTLYGSCLLALMYTGCWLPLMPSMLVLVSTSTIALNLPTVRTMMNRSRIKGQD
ncbi:MAG: CHASE2 domain-containing protein, partial [Symploca sp. SIO3E6]|nr:CHASE2 domain-containing protein [Caldora sp. SIO3E6]